MEKGEVGSGGTNKAIQPKGTRHTHSRERDQSEFRDMWNVLMTLDWRMWRETGERSDQEEGAEGREVGRGQAMRGSLGLS